MRSCSEAAVGEIQVHHPRFGDLVHPVAAENGSCSDWAHVGLQNGTEQSSTAAGKEQRDGS